MSAVSARALDEAIAWQLCLGSGAAEPGDHQAFAQWLAASAEHALVWQQLGELERQLAPAAAPLARRALQRSAQQLRQHRRSLGRSALGLLLAGGLLLGLLAQQRPLGDYLADQRTAAGEQRSLRLADRSLVRMNSRSALDIEFDEQERRLRLRSGEILVETAHGDPRPFLVETAEGRLQALGTRFLVRREGNTTRLVVLQSAVAAQPARRDQRQVIDAGQQLRIDAAGLGRAEAAPLAADAWSRGMLVAENLPLGELLARLGEYRSGYLGVADELADLRISGSFPLHDSDLALAALPPSLPVRIERHTDWWVEVVPAQP